MLKSLKDCSSLEDLAALLGYQPKALSFILYKIPNADKYTSFDIPKKRGGVRHILAPNKHLKLLQRRLANVLYECRDEIEKSEPRRSLSHGFRRQHSIISNASRHKRRRYVLNLDLQDFFPTFNFGRVRGYFIKDRSFELNPKVATLVAQIACHDNMLPQGSPCSPIISDLIGHLLDVRLARLAKKYSVTYSRYADDLTFSTSQKDFPTALAKQAVPPAWHLGEELVACIVGTGFTINPNKTRMQSRPTRQTVTGLTVNEKVNIQASYYRSARAMCNTLFKTGKFYSEKDGAGTPMLSDSLPKLEGILSHIHHIKDSVDRRKEPEKRKDATASRALYARFLHYRFFVALEKPLIVCEGKTDNVYLKQAIRHSPAFHPKLGVWVGADFQSRVRFFKYTNRAHGILQLGGGSGDLKYLFIHHEKRMKRLQHKPLKHPVIVLIDNDKGGLVVMNTVNSTFGKSISLATTDPFYHVVDNLYLMKTPEKTPLDTSYIEGLFPPKLLETEIGGKRFNPEKDHGADGEYGKDWFAEKVVRPNADKIDFSGFAVLLDRIAAVIDHYKPAAIP